MLQEPFAVGNSLLHRIDPRIRITVATVYSITAALSRQFTALTLAISVSFLLVVLAKLSFREVIKRLLVVNTFCLFFWLLLPLTFRGAEAFSIGPVSIFRSGITMAGQITLKANAILLALTALIATMSFATFGAAFHRLHVPDKIVHLLLLTYRYVFVIEQEYQRLIRAAKIRGFRPETNVHTYRTYAFIIGMLLVRSAARAERVYQAMLCRGFKRKFYCLHEFATSSREWLFAVLSGSVILLLIYLEQVCC